MQPGLSQFDRYRKDATAPSNNQSRIHRHERFERAAAVPGFLRSSRRAACGWIFTGSSLPAEFQHDLFGCLAVLRPVTTRSRCRCDHAAPTLWRTISRLAEVPSERRTSIPRPGRPAGKPDIAVERLFFHQSRFHPALLPSFFDCLTASACSGCCIRDPRVPPP